MESTNAEWCFPRRETAKQLKELMGTLTFCLNFLFMESLLYTLLKLTTAL